MDIDELFLKLWGKIFYGLVDGKKLFIDCLFFWVLSVVFIKKNFCDCLYFLVMSNDFFLEMVENLLRVLVRFIDYVCDDSVMLWWGGLYLFWYWNNIWSYFGMKFFFLCVNNWKNDWWFGVGCVKVKWEDFVRNLSFEFCVLLWGIFLIVCIL